MRIGLSADPDQVLLSSDPDPGQILKLLKVEFLHYKYTL